MDESVFEQYPMRAGYRYNSRIYRIGNAATIGFQTDDNRHAAILTML